MAVFKCKMCGGQLEITEGMTVCECEYCGTQQTLPKSDNEQALNMINRANHFRQQCEFDKAAEVYEKLIAQNDSDAELYWSLALCRYGIEYVDDPLTHKKIATCHRTQFKSILDDADYLAAIERADFMQKPVYEAEAKYIDTIQKGILEISNKEEPFDVFICYKESDENGKRTPDSVLAQELYYQLTQEGFKVFFSRITLEDKLGTQYEPYIFAALNSAKVMVVVGTKPEYFNAVWVRNEWSRYLMLMQEDRSRTLIPAYKDMDPYDLPDALSMFQAQDMSKLGFMQDLIRGIRKIVKADEPKPQVVQQTVVQNVGNTQTAPLLKRIKLFLEDGDWNSANDYCNRVLDLDPECAQAYFYLMMAKLQARTVEQIGKMSLENGISGEDYYKKAFRFADDELKTKLDSLHKQTIYNSAEGKFRAAKTNQEYDAAQRIYQKIPDYKDSAEKIKACKENALQYLYDQAIVEMNRAKDSRQFTDSSLLFAKLSGFKDAEQKARECEEKAEEYARIEAEKAETARKEQIYVAAKNCVRRDIIPELETAIRKFEDISDYMDSAEYIDKAKARIEEIKSEELAKEQERQRQEEARQKEIARQKRRNKIIAIVSAVVVAVGVAGTVVGINVYKSNLYKSAVSAFEAGDYEKAYDNFYKVKSYKDSDDYLAKPEIIQGADVGDIVTFGDYTWYVINKTDSGCTLLSEECVAEKAYNEKYESITWEECTLRTWLNNDFYNEFSDEEKALIEKTHNSNPDNSEYNTDGGSDTDDYVFLLSLDEAEKVDENIRATGSWWWLRSPGYDQYDAAEFDRYGSLGTYGEHVNNENGVRPALNLKF